jgi:hypothetical protein
VIGPLRAMAARRLDRAILVLSGAVCLGFAAAVALGLPGSRTATGGSSAPVTPQRRWSSPATRAAVPSVGARKPGAGAPRRPIQDPQDRPGSPAAARARRELRTHRALQDLPWRGGDASIGLVAARGPKAVLEVRAPSIRAGRRVYRAFLRAHDDDGRAYLPIFRAGGGGRGR